MSAPDWNQEKLVKKWIDISKNYGDPFRRCLINPIISQLLISQDSDLLLYQAFDKWTENIKSSEKDKWYHRWATLGLTTSILDLGCGEGYRARWLATPTTTYVGVDASLGLLDAARSIRTPGATWLEADLDSAEAALQKIKQTFPQSSPPDWIFAITVLDHLAHPEQLLQGIANMYDYRSKGKLLAVTCNPEFYNAGRGTTERTQVTIASVGGDEGKVDVYLRSAEEMRLMFRDCGLQLLDEASPPLPLSLSLDAGESDTILHEHLCGDYNLAHGPFNFWLLELRGSARLSVANGEIERWRQDLAPAGAQSASAQHILSAIKHSEEQLSWRKTARDQFLFRPHNVGGRLFIVRSGEFELAQPIDKLTGSETRFRFVEGDVIGELETTESVNRRTLYSAGVKACNTEGFSSALEIPAAVVHKVLTSAPGLLGNPFFIGLKRKLLRKYLQADPRLIRINKPGVAEYIEVGNLRGSELSTRYIQIMASMLVEGLERERERPGASQRPLIVISKITESIAERYVTVQENERTAATHFLAQAGVIRRTAAIDSTQNGENAQQLNKSSHTKREQRARKGLAAGMKNFLDQHQSGTSTVLKRIPKDCLFFVDDEFMLRRCAFEEDEGWLPILAARAIHFGRFEQPECVVDASVSDFIKCATLELRQRFDENDGAHDSFGWPLHAKRLRV